MKTEIVEPTTDTPTRCLFWATVFAEEKSTDNGRILRRTSLYEGRDLAMTTDFRDVFGEIASRHLGNKNLQSVFPGYSINESKFKGFL